MKKITFALAVIALLATAGCQREKDFVTPEIGENGVAFILKGAPLTRSLDAATAVEKATFPVGIKNSDEKFYLEETVEDLNAAFAPATKGTPAYTENVGTLYANQLGVYAAGKFGDTVYEVKDEYEHIGEPNDGVNKNGWRYQHIYDGDPWPDETTPVDFYLRMPTNMTENGVSDLAYAKADGKTTISFSLTSPETAAAQQDLIFTTRTLTKTEHQKFLPNGSPVLFYHALTGVKFRIVNNDEHEIDEVTGNPKGKTDRTQTYITKVTLKGLKNAGTCVVTPDAAEADRVVWTLNGTTGTFTQSFEETNIVDYEKDGSFDNNGKYANSFAAAANKNNLNDGDASMTFWFIPQEMTDEVTMEVEFHVWSGQKNEATKTLTVNLGKIAKGNDLTKAWNAGELRTFSLKPLDVNVEITDTMEKYVKSDVKIKNTGNVSQYVRVYIIGNWVGKRQIDQGMYNTDDTILMGYTTHDGEDEVLRWNDKDFTGTAASPTYQPWTAPGGKEYSYTPYGTFVNLPPMGTSTAGGTMVNKWIRHDKFYYYTEPIGPNQFVPDSTPLFESYTVTEDKIPDFWIADNTGTRRLAKDVHLVMDIAVQAIEAKMDESGNPTKTYAEAWAEALGVTVEGLNDL